MDSQNVETNYFTNLLNEDHQFDSVYDWQSASPITVEDSSPLATNDETYIKRPSRGVNFTLDEDKLLVSAWLNCSLDAVQGTDQKHSQLWERIFNYFQTYKVTTIERTTKSLTHRWSIIQKATNKFCAKLAQVNQLNQSGMTEQDKIEKAKIMYQSLEKCNFQFEHCWQQLKDQPKWIQISSREDLKRRKTISVSSTPIKCSDATEDNTIENEIVELDRPIGRKAEKGKRKALGRQIEENFQLRKMKYSLLEESRAQEKEFYRLKAKKMKYDQEKEEKRIRQEDERLRLEAEKIEIAKKEADQRIMMMDVNGLPETVRLYFLQLQNDILAKQNLSKSLD